MDALSLPKTRDGGGSSSSKQNARTHSRTAVRIISLDSCVDTPVSSNWLAAADQGWHMGSPIKPTCGQWWIKIPWGCLKRAPKTPTCTSTCQRKCLVHAAEHRKASQQKRDLLGRTLVGHVASSLSTSSTQIVVNKVTDARRHWIHQINCT